MSRRPVDVALLFEKAAREIDVACALKHILSRRHGLQTEIIQQNYPDPAVVRDLMPAVVVLPFCYQERSNNLFLVRWREATFFNLTWEQLFYPGNARAKTPRGEFATRHVIHNAWSDDYAGVLRGAGVPDEHVIVTGNPAYTLYDEPYRRYFKSKSELASATGLDVARRWVFFPENYNWAFYEPAMIQQMIRDGQPAAQVSSMVEQVTRSFEIAMQWCAALARRADVEVIVRPRPATPAEDFRRRVYEVVDEVPSTMSILQGDTVRDWILASDVVLSSYSTSLIEASIAGKPSYIVEPVPWPEALVQPWHALVPRVASSEDFEAAALSTDSRPRTAPIGAWARRMLMGRGDAILLIADQIASIRHRSVPIPRPPPWRSITLPSRRKLPPRIAFELRRHVLPHLLGKWDVAAEYRRDVAVIPEIPDRVRRWADVLDPYLESRHIA